MPCLPERAGDNYTPKFYKFEQNKNFYGSNKKIFGQNQSFLTSNRKNLGKMLNFRAATSNHSGKKNFSFIKNKHWMQKKFEISGEDLFLEIPMYEKSKTN